MLKISNTNTRNTRSERNFQIKKISLAFTPKTELDLSMKQNIQNPNKKDSKEMTKENTTTLYKDENGFVYSSKLPETDEVYQAKVTMSEAGRILLRLEITQQNSKKLRT